MAPVDVGEHGGGDQVDGGVQVEGAQLAARHAALQDAAHQGVAGFHHLFEVETGQFREIAALAGHQLADAPSIGVADALLPDLEGVAHQLGGGAGKGLQLGLPFGKAPGDVLAHHGLEQGLLAGVVQKEGALGHLGQRGDFLHLGGGIAFLDKQARGGLQQLGRAGLLAAAAAARGRGAGGGVVGHGWTFVVNDPWVSSRL